jgi:CheY-like chemotaxis protein
MNGIETHPKEFSILIADDLGCREVLRELVEGVGYRTLLAASGEEALELASDTEVHLALLDMNLPKLTGLETLQLVRQMHAMLPGILVTADNSQSLMREAQRSSVYSVLPKPVRKEMVLGTVARALRKHYGCA